MLPSNDEAEDGGSMTRPIAPGRAKAPPSSFPAENQVSPQEWQKIWKLKARDAPITPAKIKPAIDRQKVDPTTLKAAEGMEAMFLNYMMSAMRKTVPKNSFNLENAATKIYRQMLDTEVAKTAARGQGVGLAEQIIAYLQRAGYNNKRTSPAMSARPRKDTRAEEADRSQNDSSRQPVQVVKKNRSTGGTDEGS